MGLVIFIKNTDLIEILLLLSLLGVPLLKVKCQPFFSRCLFLLNHVSISFLANIPPLFHDYQLLVLKGILIICGYVN